jgi:hypothetical protein
MEKLNYAAVDKNYWKTVYPLAIDILWALWVLVFSV